MTGDAVAGHGGNVTDGIGATGVFRDGIVVKVDVTRPHVDHHILENRTETAGSLENLWLLLPG